MEKNMEENGTSSEVGTNSEIDSQENLAIDDIINLEIEELDDTEYAIPAVDQLPSLESILAEPDTNSLCGTDDDFTNLSVERLAVSETLSIGSLLSLSSPSRPRVRPTPTSGIILQHLILKGICAQLTSASEKINAGLASAVAAGGSMIAVGTSHGFILNFDNTQTLKWCHRDTKLQGSVSAICFNHDGSRILAGFAKGNILMIDSLNGKVLRILTDVHPPGTAVLHVKFTDSPKLALCSDSGGSVFELTFTRTMGVRGCDSKCLFSGSRGEVCTLEPLLLNELPNHPLKSYTLVAMATLSKVIVVCIRPRMRVVLTHPLSGSPIAPPQISWQLVVIRAVNGMRIVDPVLALARDTIVHFYQVCSEAGMRVRLTPLRRIVLPYTISNLRWMNSKALAVMDVQEKLHLIDVRTQENLETLDISNVGLSYASSYFKGLSTGGNVSKAMALAGERACYNTVITFGSQLLLLGMKSLHAICIRTWTERLSHLTSQKRYREALALGLEFYRDKGKAVVGLKGSKQRRKQIVQDKVESVLIRYMDELNSTFSSSSSDTGHSDLEIITICVEYCVQLECKELLFGKLWDIVSECETYREVYLRALENPLIDGSLSPDLPPTIVQQLVTLYDQESKLDSLQSIIIILNVECLDIHQVTNICKRRALWEALIHLETTAFGDYTAPIHQLIPVLQKYLQENINNPSFPQECICLGNALLVYASCCLTGRQFPRKNDLPEGQRRKVKADMLRALLAQHSSLANEMEKQYPYLRTLLKFDAKGFLDAIAMAFQESEFTTEMGLRQRQRVVDILFSLATPESPLETDDSLTTEQKIFVLIFIVNEVIESTVILESNALCRILEVLCIDTYGGHKNPRESTIMRLLQNNKLSSISESTILNLAKRANFLQVLEFVYTTKGDWEAVCECLIADKSRNNEIMPLLQQLPTIQIEKILKNWCDHIIEIDVMGLANIIITRLPEQIDNVLNELDKNLKNKYELSSALIRLQKEDIQGNNKDFSNDTQKLVAADAVDIQNGRVELSQEALEIHLKLMCEFEPHKVIEHLKSSYGCSVEKAMEIVVECDRKDAQALLLEQSGDKNSAYNILLHRLSEINTMSDREIVHEEEAIQISCQLSGLCRRAAGTLDWIPFVDTILSLQSNNFIKDSKHFGENLLKIILESLSGSTAFSTVLEHIFKQPIATGGTIGDVKELLTGVLAQTKYEQTLVETTSRLVSLELHELLKKTLRNSGKPYKSNSAVCLACRKFLARSQECIVVFECSHTYHVDCLSEPKMCFECLNKNGWETPILNFSPPETTAGLKSKRELVPPAFMQTKFTPLTLSPPVPWPDLEDIL